MFRPLRGVELAIEDQLPNIQGQLSFEKRFFPSALGGEASISANLEGYRRESTVDQLGRDIEGCFVRLAQHHTTAFGGELDLRYVSVTSHIPLGAVVGATPDGRRAREPLSESISPSQGMDVKGPTATLMSISSTKCAQYKERAARLLNMKLSPASLVGEAGTRKLMALIRTACDMKMWHIQFNIVNRDTLLAAQKDPDKYRNLLVRVAGYSAYFVDLTPALQNEIIRRTEHEF